MADFDDVIRELEAVQSEVSYALRSGAALAAEAKKDLPPELLAEIEASPVETLLRDLILTGEEQATKDRAQIAKLVVLLDKVNVKVDGLEVAATAVATDLAAAQVRADAVTDQPPGAAADAGIRSSPT